ncbi:hypothetical protein B0H67DRAFT_450757, partial [Lasiosphaeris hirsuta]
LQLSGLAALVCMAVTVAADCIDCKDALIANSRWQNGDLAPANYYAPVKGAGNWGKADSIPGDGLLDMRYEEDIGYYIRSTCPKTHSGYCRTFLNQVVSIQDGVEYDFDVLYQMRNVRNAVDTIEVYVETLDRNRRLFDQNIFSGNTAGWVTFGSLSFTADFTGDVVFTITWRNDPNDAVVEIREIAMKPLECQPPLVETSTKTCSEEPVASSTAPPSSSAASSAASLVASSAVSSAASSVASSAASSTTSSAASSA